MRFEFAAPPDKMLGNLYYSTTGVTAAAPIACRFWKTAHFKDSQPGPEKVGLPAMARTFLFLETDFEPSDNPMAGHIVCRLKPGARILGYRVNSN